VCRTGILDIVPLYISGRTDFEQLDLKFVDVIDQTARIDPMTLLLDLSSLLP